MPRASREGDSSTPVGERRARLTLAQLASYDDVLTDALVDRAFFWTKIRKNRPKYFPARGFSEDDVTQILLHQVIVGKDIAKAEKLLLNLSGLKKYLASLSSDREKDWFRRHLRKYISIYLPDCPFEVSTTNRYTILNHEAAITARKYIKKGEPIKYLSGTMVAITKEEEKDLDVTRKDFSIVMSSRKKTPSLFLGPARFANHDCNANGRLVTRGTEGMEVVAARDIEIGDEITVSYGDDYFGIDNCECLCQSCEEIPRNGWAGDAADSAAVSVVDEEPVTEGYALRGRLRLGLGRPSLTPESTTPRKKARTINLVQQDSVASDDVSLNENSTCDSPRSVGNPTTLKLPESNSRKRKRRDSEESDGCSPSKALKIRQPSFLRMEVFPDTPVSQMDLELWPLAASQDVDMKADQLPDSTEKKSSEETIPTTGTINPSIKSQPDSTGPQETNSLNTRLVEVASSVTDTQLQTPPLHASSYTSLEIVETIEQPITEPPAPETSPEDSAATYPSPKSPRPLIDEATDSAIIPPDPPIIVTSDPNAAPSHSQTVSPLNETPDPSPLRPKRKYTKRKILPTTEPEGPAIRIPGDYIKTARLLGQPYDRWVDCRTCESWFVQSDGYLTRKECPRCERHSKLYGYQWPKTEKMGKGDREERIMDHRTVHRFLRAEEVVKPGTRGWRRRLGERVEVEDRESEVGDETPEVDVDDVVDEVEPAAVPEVEIELPEGVRRTRSTTRRR